MIAWMFTFGRVNDSLVISLLRLKPVHRVKGFALPEECMVGIVATQDEFDHHLPQEEVIYELLLFCLSWEGRSERREV